MTDPSAAPAAPPAAEPAMPPTASAGRPSISEGMAIKAPPAKPARRGVMPRSAVAVPWRALPPVRVTARMVLPAPGAAVCVLAAGAEPAPENI